MSAPRRAVCACGARAILFLRSGQGARSSRSPLRLRFGRLARRAASGSATRCPFWALSRRRSRWPSHGLNSCATPGYWQSWYWSFLRVLLGFSAATLVGVPFGLFLAISKTFRGIAFPVFELLRPIPPLAWVPASIIFWPDAGAFDRFRHLPRCLLHESYSMCLVAPGRSTSA